MVNFFKKFISKLDGIYGKSRYEELLKVLIKLGSVLDMVDE